MLQAAQHREGGVVVVVDEVDEMAVAVVVSFLLIVCGSCDQMIGWLKVVQLF